MDELLTIKGLSKSFGRKEVLKNFDLKLEKGKVYGLLGKNGAGKTTLIRMIMGVIPWDRGEIIYRGQTLKFADAAYKRNIGFIPEDSIFFSWMKIKELLNFNSSFYSSWNSKKAEIYLDRLGLDSRLKLRHLSRGMKLKVGLVVALAAEPEFLILDDPTSGLDVPTRQEFMRDVIREILEGGTTILFSSHLVHELEGIIDKMGILHEGHLVIEDEYVRVKDTTKRVLLLFENSIPTKISIKGVLTQKKDHNRLELVIHPWNEVKHRELESLDPAHMEVDPLTLEEIFVSFVS
ncbi:MAG: ABC transporter ATP-binding protein [Candidatus Aminicenantes bacterium]|jgi:ABC-2 type transport system ATP-binding protein